MKKSVFMLALFSFLFAITSCKNIDSSQIEVIKIDMDAVDEITKSLENDSVYLEYPKRKDFWSIEHYFVKPNRENLVFKDSVGNVVGVVKRINGNNIEAAEYFSNGQLKGKIGYSEPGILDGDATYYYQDGRIMSKGTFKSGNKIGEWRNFNKYGELVSTELYNENGIMTKKKN